MGMDEVGIGMVAAEILQRRTVAYRAGSEAQP
jgi:hypothetical protein